LYLSQGNSIPKAKRSEGRGRHDMVRLNDFPWCIQQEGPPVPIPNTEVKPLSAHGTAGTFRGRVGLRQGSNIRHKTAKRLPVAPGGVFCWDHQETPRWPLDVEAQGVRPSRGLLLHLKPRPQDRDGAFFCREKFPISRIPARRRVNLGRSPR
jgi:hypothetical protein